jgi:hypothetical protein
MSNRLRIFISAGPDLESEREVVGKAIASLPVSVGWVINYTPIGGHPTDPAMKSVVDCDFYALLLGRDIAAPMGSELYVAQHTGKAVVAFVKDVPRTPAARVFLRKAPLEWKEFQQPEDLRPLLHKAVIEQILQRPEAYHISVADWEALSALSAELEETSSGEKKKGEPPGTGGAGSDAVIVAPGRDLPSGGVLVEKPSSKP